MNIKEKTSKPMNPTYAYFPNVTQAISNIPPESIVSRTIHSDEELKVVLFGFAAGQELSEHTASMPAILHILDGDASLTLGEESHQAQAGTWVHMPANLPHSVFAMEPVTMLLILIKAT
jgi:quercetin dioxygenase-like cupin family protein